jgi:Na+-translocating ferredoxin:NAD+ oxidoreductase RnfC subunit
MLTYALDTDEETSKIASVKKSIPVNASLVEIDTFLRSTNRTPVISAMVDKEVPSSKSEVDFHVRQKDFETSLHIVMTVELF